MTTTFPFFENSSSAFSFQPTLDGQQYTGVVTWNIAGQRYYVSLFTLDGSRVFTLPLVGSTDAVPIESASWANGVVTVETTEPHGFTELATMTLAIAGMAPDVYNGAVQAFVTGPTTFQYPLASDPGPPTGFGVVSYDIVISIGYFLSRMVFRQSSQQFEVTP